MADALSFFRSHLSIDIRALACLRILLGFFCILFCLSRIETAGNFYSDSGVFPIELRLFDLQPRSQRGTDFMWSVFFLNGSERFACLVLGTGAISGFFLMMGWRTKFMTILCWVIVASVRVRIPYGGDGGDSLLKVYLFWSIFLPSDERWSLNTKRSKMDNVYFSWATVGFSLQICYVYWFSALEKFDESWRSDGSAISAALQIESLTRIWADLFCLFPQFLPYLNHFVLALVKVNGSKPL